MAAQKRESKKPKPEPEKKQNEKTDATVHLSPEELRKIAGGYTVPPPLPGPGQIRKPS